MSNARTLADNLPTEGQLAGRNVIVNGAMTLSQRQTSSSNVGNQYVLDRFQVYKQNTGSTYTCSQNSVTDLAGFANSLKMDCTTADTSTAANEQVYISYFAEGQDLQRFQKGHATALGFTLSFYVKTNKAGVYTVKMFDRDNSRDVSGSYTVSDANWNRYTINFPADTTGKFDDDNASSLEIFFNLVNGSDTQGGTLNTAWRSAADASGATGQVNFADSTSNDWEITGIQLEVGPQSTPFENEPFAATLRKCQRYYSKIEGPLDAHPCWTYGTVASTQVTLPAQMRVIPSVTFTGTTASNTNNSITADNFSMYSASAWKGTNNSGVQYGGTGSSSVQSIRINTYVYSAFIRDGVSAGLYMGANCSINADAEL